MIPSQSMDFESANDKKYLFLRQSFSEIWFKVTTDFLWFQYRRRLCNPISTSFFLLRKYRKKVCMYTHTHVHFMHTSTRARAHAHVRMHIHTLAHTCTYTIPGEKTFLNFSENFSEKIWKMSLFSDTLQSSSKNFSVYNFRDLLKYFSGLWIFS